MTSAFGDICVRGWEPLEGTYGLPDPDDEHLVAAAVVGGAGAIISDNLRDLPRDLVPKQIHILTGAQFAADTVSLSPTLAMAAISRISARYKDPPRSVDELLDLATRNGWNDAVTLVRDARET